MNTLTTGYRVTSHPLLKEFLEFSWIFHQQFAIFYTLFMVSKSTILFSLVYSTFEPKKGIENWKLLKKNQGKSGNF